MNKTVKKHHVALILLTMILISSALGTVFVKVATANPTPVPLPSVPTPICIKENGEIEGADGALQRNGNTYVFVKDIDRTVEIQKNNIVIDGNGFTITKPPEVNTNNLGLVGGGWLSSILIYNRTDVVIKNLNFYKCFNAISIYGSSNITVFDNAIIATSNGGIWIGNCVYCQITGNTITNSSNVGVDIDDSSFLNISNNTISRNHDIMRWTRVSYSNVSRNDLSNSIYGINIEFLNCYNRIFENNIIGNIFGFNIYAGFQYSHDNQICSNFWNNTDNIRKLQYPDDSNWTDQSPLTSPIALNFEPSSFSPPFEESEPQSSTMATIAGVVLAVTIIIATSLLFYRHRHSKLAQKPQTSKFS